jgi:hypothetical protein
MARGGNQSGPSAREIEAALRRRAGDLAYKLLPKGRQSACGRFWEAGSVGGEGAIGKNGSLKVNLKDDSGLWNDFSAPAGTDEAGGDMLQLIAAVLFGGWSRDGAKKDAIDWAKSWLGWDDLEPGRLNIIRRDAIVREAVANQASEQALAAKRKKAAALWHGSVPIAGTPAFTYLVGRGIDFGKLGRIPNSLRYLPDAWCPERRGKYPAMIACIMALGGELLGVHRTFLDVSGGKFGPVGKARVENAKLSLGHYRGGCIPLSKGASRATLREIAAGTPVYCSEGIEDGLTVAMALPEARVVAGVALANIGGLDLPAQAGPLVLIGQNDPIGSKAVEALEGAIARQQAAGRAVQVIFPAPQFKDFNDQLLGKKREGVTCTDCPSR